MRMKSAQPGVQVKPETHALRPAYQDVLYKVHLDMHCPEWDPSILSEFDARQIVECLAGKGVRGMVVFAKDTYGNAYYDTAIGHKHACLDDRDLLAEFLEEGRRLGVAMAAYFCAILDNRACEEHPDWQLRGADGEPLSDEVSNPEGARWKSVCPNSAYAEVAEAMIDEIGRDYDVDGFHLDMFNLDFGQVSCYCDNCARLFRDETGRDLPRVPRWDDDWAAFLDFRYRSVERYMMRLRVAAKRRVPEAPVVMNYHGAPGFDWRTGQMPVRHSLPSDMGTGETYTPMLGDFYPGLATRFIKSIAPERPTEVVSWRMNRITDFTTKPVAQLRWELLASLVHGAHVMLIDQPFASGHMDEYPYKRFEHIFREIEAKEPWFGGEPVPHVGIYYSCLSRDWYGRDRQERFQLPVMGAYRAAVESHCNVGFVFDETVSLETLRQFPVIILPGVAAMTLREAELFTEYVRQGGTLVATRDTSLFDERGKPLPNYRLAEAFGVDYAGPLDCDACYLQFNGDSLSRDVDEGCFILTRGHVARVAMRTAQGVGDLFDSFHKKRMPDQFFSHSMHPPHGRVQHAAYVNHFGEGACVYFPAGVDAAYADTHELPEHRTLLRNAIETARWKPPVRVLAPLNVESALFRKDGKLLLHLLAFNPLRRPTTLPSLNTPIRPSLRMEESPCYRVELSLGEGVRSVRAINSTTELAREGDRVRATCSDLHETFVFELERAPSPQRPGRGVAAR